MPPHKADTLSGCDQSSNLATIIEAGQVFPVTARAANFDALAGPDILESRHRHSHISAKSNLESHILGDFDAGKAYWSRGSTTSNVLSFLSI